MFSKVLSMNIYFKCLKQIQNFSTVIEKLCSSKFSSFVLWLCEISAQCFIADKLLPGQDFILGFIVKFLQKEEALLYMSCYQVAPLESFPEAWRNRLGCVQEQGVLHVDALLLCCSVIWGSCTCGFRLAWILTLIAPFKSRPLLLFFPSADFPSWFSWNAACIKMKLPSRSL